MASANIFDIKNWFQATKIDSKKGARNPNSLLAPVQFYRERHDPKSWRDAVTEMENPILPYRVQAQKIYADNILNGHVFACMEKRKNMVMMKNFAIMNGENKDDKSTSLITKSWFYDIINYVLDARAFGYTLLYFGNIVGDDFESVGIVKRENISPDRLNVSPIVYSPQGVMNFMDQGEVDQDGLKFYDWTAWIPTHTETAQSTCGYGYLYKVALYEIHLRNLLSSNADYIEVYGQPIRHAKSSKTEGPEYDQLVRDVADMGSNSYVVTDHETELLLIQNSTGGKGTDVHATFEERLEKKVSKIILGHADALDSTPGKLGANEAAEQSLIDTCVSDCRFVENAINKIIMPKLINLGIKIPLGTSFSFLNDAEKMEAIERQNESNKLVAEYADKFKSAGYDLDEKELSDRTGLTVKKSVPVKPDQKIDKNVQNKLNELYGNA